MTPDVGRLLATPDHHFLSFERDSALFVAMERDNYFRSAFLDRRADTASQIPVRVPVAELIAATREHEPPRIGWVFHVAHCGSTLLSRLIDGPQSSLILREPPPLRQMGLAAAAGDRSASWNDRLRLAHAMAARRFDADRPTIVKANVPVNFMLNALHGLDAEAPAILLHFALEPYLVAILRSPQHGTWVERITDSTAPALAERVGLARGAAIAERAAALWLVQMLAFAKLLESNSSASSLDAHQLFEAPADTAAAVARHLGVSDVDFEANAAELAGHYAKDMSRSFDEGERKQRELDDRIRLEPELAIARRWVDGSPAAAGLLSSLGRPVIGAAPQLLG